MSNDKTTKVSASDVEQTQSVPPVDNPYWRQELEDLDRRFDGMLTAEQAQQYADEQLCKHDGIILYIEAQLARLKSTLAEPFLRGSDKQALERKIEAVEGDLALAKQRRKRSINLCGAGIRTAKEWEPKRARWEELKKRQRDVDNASCLAKEFQPRGWLSSARTFHRHQRRPATGHTLRCVESLRGGRWSSIRRQIRFERCLHAHRDLPKPGPAG